MSSSSSSSPPTKPSTSVNLQQASITDVKVYNDRAEITREISLTLVEGEQYITFSNVQDSIIQDSVRVTGYGAGSVLEVSYKERTETITNDRTKANDLQSQIDVLVEKRKELHSSLTRVTSSETFLEKYATSLIDVGSVASTSKVSKLELMLEDQTLEKVTEFLKFYRQQLATLDSQEFKKRIEIEELDSQISKLREQLSKEPAEKTYEQRREFVVLTHVQQAGVVKFKVVYMVNRAKWTAQYDLRYNSSTQTLELTYFGVITQETKEDWNNVQLALSTANPTTKSEPPELKPLTIGYQPVHHYDMYDGDSYMQRGEKLEMLMDQSMELESRSRKFSEKKKAGGFGFLGAIGGMMHAAEEALAAPPPPPPMKVSITKTEQGATSSSFIIERRSAIPSDNLPHKVTIGVISISDCVTEYYTVPKAAASAYLKVKATNNTSLSFLRGPMNVFLDGSFVTTSNMNNVAPSEEFELYLGTDEAIKIEYQGPMKFRETKGVFGGYQAMKFRHYITIKNNKSYPIKITAVDQYPRPSDSSIKFKAIEPDIKFWTAEKKELENFYLDPQTKKQVIQKFSMDADTSQLTWTLKVEPSAKVKIPVVYDLEYYQNYDLII